MPVYEFQCTKCQQIFEYQLRMADPPKTECEACGGALEKIISRSAFQFKGGGWYKDLYSSAKSDGGASGGSAARAANPGDGSGSGGASGAGSTSNGGEASASPSSSGGEGASGGAAASKP